MSAPKNPVRGEAHHRAKLTEEDVLLIIEAANERKRLRAEADQLSNRSLAKKFGVHRRAIENITSGKGWAHVGSVA